MNIISFLQTCFYVCMVCAIIFFVISVVLFFVFDIKTIFNYKTGRAKAKTMKAMMETYDRTGRLQGSGKLSSSGKKKRGKGGGKKKASASYDKYSVQEEQPAQQLSPQPNASYAAQPMYASQEQTRSADSGSEGTSLLYNSNPTEVLRQVRVQPYNPGVDTTARLSDGGAGAVQAPAAEASFYGGVDVHLNIVKKLVLVHTDEIIQ